MNLKIALLQIAPGGSLEENLEKGIRACREAKKQGADIALFPEMWSNGYRIYDCPPEQWKAGAIPADDGFILAFGKLARELELAICVTFLEAWEGGPRNSLVLFDRFGETGSSLDLIARVSLPWSRHGSPPHPPGSARTSAIPAMM